MNFFETTDYKWLHIIHDALSHTQKTKAIKRFTGCMHLTTKTGVTIIKKGEKVHFHGLTRCKNGWICPVCAPVKLAQTKRLVAAAFQKFSHEQDYKCCMTTFTIPHRRADFVSGEGDVRKRISLATLLYVLKTAYRKFWSYSRLRWLRTNAKTFLIYELTYSEKFGWHPHIHALHWFKPEDFDEYTSYEEKLNEFWRHTLSVVYKEITWSDSERNSLVRTLENTQHRNPVFISKDNDGKPRNITQPEYFWGGADEVTGATVKKAHRGNLNQWQILEKIIKNQDPTGKYINLVKEIIESTYSLNLFRFKPGLVKELKEYLETHPIPLITKKKNIKNTEEKPKAQIVCWLSPTQWHYLRYIEHIKYLTLILASFAAQDNAFELIEEFCLAFNIGPPSKQAPFTLKFKNLEVQAA